MKKSINKILTSGLIIVLLFTLTGCVKFNITANVHNDGSIDVLYEAKTKSDGLSEFSMEDDDEIKPLDDGGDNSDGFTTEERQINEVLEGSAKEGIIIVQGKGDEKEVINGEEWVKETMRYSLTPEQCDEFLSIENGTIYLNMKDFVRVLFGEESIAQIQSMQTGKNQSKIIEKNIVTESIDGETEGYKEDTNSSGTGGSEMEEMMVEMMKQEMEANMHITFPSTPVADFGTINENTVTIDLLSEEFENIFNEDGTSNGVISCEVPSVNGTLGLIVIGGLGVSAITLVVLLIATIFSKMRKK